MHLPSETSLLPHFSWLLHLLIGYQKPFQTNHSKPYISKESKAKCNPHSGWLSDSNNRTKAKCSGIWSTSHRWKPFHLPRLTQQVLHSNLWLTWLSTNFQTMPYHLVTSLLPRTSWLLHPWQKSTQKTQHSFLSQTTFQVYPSSLLANQSWREHYLLQLLSKHLSILLLRLSSPTSS